MKDPSAVTTVVFGVFMEFGKLKIAPANTDCIPKPFISCFCIKEIVSEFFPVTSTTGQYIYVHADRAN